MIDDCSVKSTLRILPLVLLLGGLLASGLTGCSRDAGSLDRRDEEDSLVAAGLEKEKLRDIDGAIDLYEQALARNSDLARPHLQLGLLYDKYRQDYVRAIYHYERYIEMRPKADKRDLIFDLIRQARISYAASLPDQPSRAIQLVAQLKKENEQLKDEMSRMSGDAAAVRDVLQQTSVPSSRSTGPRPAPAQSAVRSYVVKRGDSLSSIAQKMYGDAGQWRKIYEANRDKMPKPESLRLGLTLIIPE